MILKIKNVIFDKKLSKEEIAHKIYNIINEAI